MSGQEQLSTEDYDNDFARAFKDPACPSAGRIALEAEAEIAKIVKEALRKRKHGLRFIKTEQAYLNKTAYDWKCAHTPYGDFMANYCKQEAADLMEAYIAKQQEKRI